MQESGKGEDRAEALERRFASLGRLAATMAHEFNNVLMVIQPFVQLMARGSNPVQTETALRHIGLSIQRGKQITAEILRFAHPPEPTVHSVGVGTWLKSFAMDLQGILPPTVSLQIENDDGGEPLYACMDLNQMNQVLMNLAINAKDAMPDGGTLTITAARCYSWSLFPFATALTQPERFILLTVANTGRGMDEATLDQIFEPLFTTKRNGTGLGLAIVRQIVHGHVGSVSVESSVATGTSFHLFLPAAAPPEHEEPAPEPLPTCRTNLRLLLAEDDHDVSAAIASALREMGFEILQIYTGGAALGTVRDLAPDAVILDVGLPDIQGDQVFWALRAEFPHLPIVFSTGHAEEIILGDAMQEPNVALLRKPYAIDALLGALAQVTGAEVAG